MITHPDLTLLRSLRRSEPSRRAKRAFTVALASWAIAIYLMLGLASATAFKYAVPAISPAGEAYVALTWPAWINGSPLRPPIYRWCFEFKDGDGD